MSELKDSASLIVEGVHGNPSNDKQHASNGECGLFTSDETAERNKPDRGDSEGPAGETATPAASRADGSAPATTVDDSNEKTTDMATSDSSAPQGNESVTIVNDDEQSNDDDRGKDDLQPKNNTSEIHNGEIPNKSAMRDGDDAAGGVPQEVIPHASSPEPGVTSKHDMNNDNQLSDLTCTSDKPNESMTLAEYCRQFRNAGGRRKVKQRGKTKDMKKITSKAIQRSVRDFIMEKSKMAT